MFLHSTDMGSLHATDIKIRNEARRTPSTSGLNNMTLFKAKVDIGAIVPTIANVPIYMPETSLKHGRISNITWVSVNSKNFAVQQSKKEGYIHDIQG